MRMRQSRFSSCTAVVGQDRGRRVGIVALAALLVSTSAAAATEAEIETAWRLGHEAAMVAQSSKDQQYG